MPDHNFHTALEAFRAIADALVKEHFEKSWDDDNRKKYPDFPVPQITIMPGARYVRLVRGQRKPISGEVMEGQSAFCFVDMTNGDILKASGWKAPAKGKRGSIYDADGGRSAITQYGARSLR